MRIAIVQPDLHWNDPAANFNHLADLMATVSGVDLFVLPEMFSTGFVTAEEVSLSSDAMSWMVSFAASSGAAVAGSVAARSAGKLCNRFYFVTPDGGVQWYDKHHLFTYGGEHHRFTAGSERRVVEWKGVRILLQVCYDLRFPVFSRNFLRPDGSADYDLALYVASWPVQRSEVWKLLLRARAIENQCFLAGVNRVGSDPGNEYSGDSVVLDFMGSPLASCTPFEEGIAVADIDLAALRSARESFPVLADAD